MLIDGDAWIRCGRRCRGLVYDALRHPIPAVGVNLVEGQCRGGFITLALLLRQPIRDDVSVVHRD